MAALVLRALVLSGFATSAATRRIDGTYTNRLLQVSQPPARPVFANVADTVCGGGSIRQFLVTPDTATEVRNIPWSEVEALADEYLRNQTNVVSRLQADLDRLKVEIPAREKLEAVKPLAIDAVVQSITSAFIVKGSYGSLQVAKATKCGEDRNVKPRLTWTSSGAKAAATDVFKAKITDLLRGADVVAEGATVRTECEKLLGVTSTGTLTYCKELCQGLAEVAVAASTGALAVRKKVDDMRRELEQITALLRAAVSEFDQCKQLKGDLSVFRSQLEGLTEDVKDTHSKLMDAREALMDAQYELDDAEQFMQAQADATTKAMDLLQDQSAVADSALAKFEALGAQAGTVRKAMEASTAQLEKAKKELMQAQSAADSVSGLKAAVSDSMLKMVMYFDEAIRVPIRAMGLGERVNIDDLFPKSTSTLESAGATQKSLSALSGFCALPETQRALGAAATKDQDPRQLCVVGDVADLQRNIDGAVSDRVGALKESLHEVQSWLYPYRGQSDAEVAAIPEYVKQGEPMGLREVISTFGKTPYFQRYLQHWKFKGKFLELYAALLAALEQAEVTHASATSKLKNVTQDLRQADRDMAAAQTALQQAVEAKSIAQGKQQEAQALLSTMTSDKLKLRVTLDNLEAAVLEAERRWKEAQQTLENAHREGVSLVQLLEEMEASWTA